MTFMRSNSGIQNYALFKGASCTIYIEGRVAKGKSASASTSTYDELFYQGLLNSIDLNIKFAIKVVGSKKDVFAYANRIYSDSISNAFVIVDSDCEGLTSSILFNEKVIRTFGYSWENDFWTRKLCFQILKDLAIIAGNSGRNIFYQKYRKMAYRLRRISELDLLMKIHGIKYIPSNDRSVGLNFDLLHSFAVRAKDLPQQKHLDLEKRKKMGSCQVIKGIRNRSKNSSFDKIIRGHLWEHACIQLISHSYKVQSGEKSMPNSVVKNIGFSRFSKDPKAYLDKKAYSHYLTSIKKAAQASMKPAHFPC